MYGEHVSFTVKGLGTFKVFVFSVPRMTKADLEQSARFKVSRLIESGDASGFGDEIEFTPEAGRKVQTLSGLIDEKDY